MAKTISPCPFGVPFCKCHDCESNAAYEDCNKGYCLNCLECHDKNEAVHNVYLCTGYERRKDNA